MEYAQVPMNKRREWQREHGLSRSALWYFKKVYVIGENYVKQKNQRVKEKSCKQATAPYIVKDITLADRMRTIQLQMVDRAERFPIPLIEEPAEFKNGMLSEKCHDRLRQRVKDMAKQYYGKAPTNATIDIQLELAWR